MQLWQPRNNSVTNRDHMALDDGIWRRLDPTRKEIRLLILDGSLLSERTLTGRLQVVSLDDHPRCDAVSWAWKRGDRTVPLHLDGHCTLLITGKLSDCLQALRNSARAVWVDAICIAQRNLEERAQQVQLM